MSQSGQVNQTFIGSILKGVFLLNERFFNYFGFFASCYFLVLLFLSAGHDPLFSTLFYRQLRVAKDITTLIQAITSLQIGRAAGGGRVLCDG